MDTNKYIIEKLEKLCSEKNMTHYRLAQKSGISQSSISNLINRRNIPSVGTLARLCEALDVTLAQFFAKEGDKPDLTEDQEFILGIWDGLSDEDKARVKAYMQGVSGR